MTYKILQLIGKIKGSQLNSKPELLTGWSIQNRPQLSTEVF